MTNINPVHKHMFLKDMYRYHNARPRGSSKQRRRYWRLLKQYTLEEVKRIQNDD